MIDQGKIWLHSLKFKFIILAVLTFSAYSFCLGAPFKALDDQYLIVENARIKSLNNFGLIFTSSFFGDGHYYRPLVEASHALEHAVFGLNPGGYLLTNIILHFLNSLLVFFLVKRLRNDDKFAFLVAALFALHPIQADDVVNISGRGILLCATFVLSGFLLFLRYKNKGQAMWLCLSLVFFLLALLSKESAVMLAVVLLVYAFWMENDRNPRKFLKTIPYFILVAGFLIFRKLIGFLGFLKDRSLNSIVLEFSTFLKGVLVYLKLYILPNDLYYDRAQKVFISFADPQAIATVFFWAILMAALILARKKMQPLTKFCIAWFFLELFPVSQILVSVGVQRGYISTAEHFVYLAGVPFFIIFLEFVLSLGKKMSAAKILSEKTQKAIAGVWVIFICAILINQAVLARRPIAQLRDSIQNNPRNARVLYALGHEMAILNHFGTAEEYFRAAINSDPSSVFAYIGLGKSLCDQGKLFECMEVYESLGDAGGLKDLLSDNKRAAYKAIIKKYEDKLPADPNNSQIYYSLGVMHAKLGDPLTALGYYKKSLELDSENAEALYNMANILLYLDKIEEAVVGFEKLLSMDKVDGRMRALAEETLKKTKEDVSTFNRHKK